MIGVLALQGGFQRHLETLKKLSCPCMEVRYPLDLEKCQGLIIPGGESTAMRKQIANLEMERPLIAFAQENPLFGTCAGLILMAQQITGEMSWTLGILDITVSRNAYGRQAQSFIEPIDFENRKIEGVFIRAPQIDSCGKGVRTLASRNSSPVLIQQGIHLAATFHPELTDQTYIHRYFVDLVESFETEVKTTA